MILSKNNCKKIKKVRPINEEEISNLSQLPENWKRVRLDNLCFLITDGKHGDCRNHENSGYFFISAKDIFNGKINYANARQIKKEDFEEVHKRTNLQPGDILVTNSGTIGRIAIATANDKTSKTTFQKSVAIIKKPNYLIDSKYLAYHLENDVEKIKLVSKGTAQKNLLLGTMSELIITICPLPEQRAIVSKIEQLFSELDNGIANLKLAQEQLKVYRQAVLKKAFEGELTRKWREQQTDLHDAGDLLEKIRKEREEASKTFGKKLKQVKPPTEDKIIELQKIPEGWKWVKIGQVSTVGTGVTPLKKRRDFYESGTIAWVTSGALNESYVNSASDYVTESALRETNLKIYPKHTLLVALYGEGKTRGKCSELLIEATTNQAIAAIVQEGTEEEIRQYLKWFLIKNYNEIRMKSSGGVQPNLNLGIIENTSFPICSLSEQHAIIQEIETRLSICDKIEQDIETNLEKAEALRQSILKKAFEGNLLNEMELAEVRKAEDWEPAEVLLERIKAENAGYKKKLENW